MLFMSWSHAVYFKGWLICLGHRQYRTALIVRAEPAFFWALVVSCPT